VRHARGDQVHSRASLPLRARPLHALAKQRSRGGTARDCSGYGAASDAPHAPPRLTGAQIDAEKSPFLVERLKIWMLPTLALIKNEKTVDYVVGLDELGGTDDFKTDTLRARLAAAGVLNYDGGGVRRAPPPQRSVRAGARGPEDEDSDFDD
jgi:hypothetical protein